MALAIVYELYKVFPSDCTDRVVVIVKFLQFFTVHS